METRFVVASVPHTGTLTVETLLDVLGVTHQRMHFGTGAFSSGQQPDPFKYLIPMRDPRKVWISYWNRDEPTDALQSRWGMLAELASQENSHVLPIDRALHVHAWGDLAQFLEVSAEAYSLPQLRAFFDSTWMNAHGRIRKGTPSVPDWVNYQRMYWGYD